MMFIFPGDFQNPNSFKRNSGKMASWRTFRIRSQKLSMSDTKCIIFFSISNDALVTMTTEKCISWMEVGKEVDVRKIRGKINEIILKIIQGKEQSRNKEEGM